MIILFAFIAPIKSYASDQIPDILIYKYEKYIILRNDILYPYMKKMNKSEWGLEGGYFCSALAKGYYAVFEIDNNELILKDIANCSKNLLGKFLSDFKVKGSKFKLNWFTDSIVIGIGEPLYGKTHEYYSVLHFEKGKLIKETGMDYREYFNRKFSSGEISEYWRDSYQKDLEIIEHHLESKKGDESEFLTKLKMKYEEKFGKPMSDYELKIREIEFRGKWGKYKFRDFEFEITRTLYGAQAKYSSKNPSEWIKVKLNIEEWLDIIRALSTCCFDKWTLLPEITSSDFDNSDGVLDIYFSNMGSAIEGKRDFIPINLRRIPNLAEFEKEMEDIIAKIREHSVKP